MNIALTMSKYQNRYRIASARLAKWNYGWKSMYFITICTHHREYFFGQMWDGNMQLSEIGKIVKFEWMKTFEIRRDMNLHMGEFVVMPDHFHAIIGIGYNRYNSTVFPIDVDRDDGGIRRGRDAMHCVSTTSNDSTLNDQNCTRTTNKFGPQSKNLASIIRGFKSAVTINARKIDPEFKWQSRYHDHVIRDDRSYHKISNYIKNNPGNWGR